MSALTLLQFTFPRELYLDRRLGVYTFEESPDTVLVVNANEAVSLEELEELYHPYDLRELETAAGMFCDEVLAEARRQEANQPVTGEEEERDTSPPTPAEPPELAGGLNEEEPPHAPSPPVDVPSPVDLEARKRAALAILGAPSRPPQERVDNLKKHCKILIREWLTGPEGPETVIAGGRDTEIHDVMVDLCGEIKPQHLLRGHDLGGLDDDVDGCMGHALASRAFGNQLRLSDLELFLLTKSAILQALSKTGYTRILKIKQHLLLVGASPSLEQKLCHYYREVEKFLEKRGADPEVISIVCDSKFIYMSSAARIVDHRSVALGAADAFLTLKQDGRMTIEVLDIVCNRLRKTLPSRLAPEIETTEKLLRDACYNEFRQSIDAELSGGDHCDFFPISRGRRGIVIFDVSGHEERASRIRDLLVEVISKLGDRTNPGRALTLLNRFALRYPLPDDIFVSMVYGVLDAASSRFYFSNAGHHAPYLLRDQKIVELDAAGGMALNIFDQEYQTASVQLEPRDCLVFYTDGLIESVRQSVATESGQDLGSGEDDKTLFGKERLEQAILRRQVNRHRAQEAVDMILSAAHDQGFVIEDDITIQVYRHV